MWMGGTGRPGALDQLGIAGVAQEGLEVPGTCLQNRDSYSTIQASTAF